MQGSLQLTFGVHERRYQSVLFYQIFFHELVVVVKNFLSYDQIATAYVATAYSFPHHPLRPVCAQHLRR